MTPGFSRGIKPRTAVSCCRSPEAAGHLDAPALSKVYLLTPVNLCAGRPIAEKVGRGSARRRARPRRRLERRRYLGVGLDGGGLDHANVDDLLRIRV